jgi:cytochrome c oxidase subunit 2
MKDLLLAAGVLPIRDLSIFDPATPSADSIRSLAVLTFAISGFIFVVVEGVLLYCTFRFRSRASTAAAEEPPQVYGSQPIEIAWTAAPTLVVFILVLVIARTLWEVKLPPPQPQPGDNALFVTVSGRQWWWEYSYDHYNGQPLGFTTANELHVPASDPDTSEGKGTGRRVYLKLRSADVCHSFWVPRLGGKVDLIPGQHNHLSFQTDQTGLFLGQCAEYCGTQHANMLLRVVVDSPADFDRWLEHERQPAITGGPASPDRSAFLGQSCINCHRVRGVADRGTYAPDLTHLMSRQTLASGIMPNTPENLRAWVVDPQRIKPGCLMPAFGLSERESAAIVRYLQTLR